MADADQAIRLAPDALGPPRLKADILAARHLYDQAVDQATASLTKHPDNPVLLNSRCWLKAIQAADLEGALADCDASLKIANLPSARDSRGFVLLRMRRFDESIAEYDAALTMRPDLPTSLYGRGLAKLGKGEEAEAEQDVAAAQRIDPKVAAQFADYGVNPPQR
jgi:tetratricopeptide (TPR) repeat protein